jgi:hypothetical protein
MVQVIEIVQLMVPLRLLHRPSIEEGIKFSALAGGSRP